MIVKILFATFVLGLAYAFVQVTYLDRSIQTAGSYAVLGTFVGSGIGMLIFIGLPLSLVAFIFRRVTKAGDKPTTDADGRRSFKL